MYIVNELNLIIVIIIILIIIKFEPAVQGRERMETLSIRKPKPHTTNPWNEEKI